MTTPAITPNMPAATPQTTGATPNPAQAGAPEPTKAFAVPDQSQAPADPTRVRGGPGALDAAGTVDMYRQFDQVGPRVRELLERLRTADPHDPRILGEILSVQLEVQQISFRVELVSKVIEHGTSGTKTVLQTQA